METNLLQSVLFVGFLVESAIFLFRKASEDWHENRWPLLAAGIGSLLAFVFDLNIPRIVGLAPSAQSGVLGLVVSYFASGMVAGRGANGINDLLAYLQSNRRTAGFEAQLAEIETNASILGASAETNWVGEVNDVEVVVENVPDGSD